MHCGVSIFYPDLVVNFGVGDFLCFFKASSRNGSFSPVSWSETLIDDSPSMDFRFLLVIFAAKLKGTAGSWSWKGHRTLLNALQEQCCSPDFSKRCVSLPTSDASAVPQEEQVDPVSGEKKIRPVAQQWAQRRECKYGTPSQEILTVMVTFKKFRLFLIHWEDTLRTYNNVQKYNLYRKKEW